MAIYYVDSTATGTNAGTSWTNAYTAFGSAVTAATADGDFIYISHAHNESLSADTTYTFANNVRVLCVNSGTGALAETAAIGVQSTGYAITVSSAYKFYARGVTFKTGGGTSAKNISLSVSDGAHAEFENCTFWIGNTHTASAIISGSQSINYNIYVKLVACVFRFNNATQGLALRGYTDVVSCSVSDLGSSPATLIKAVTNFPVANFINCDLSSNTTSILGDCTGNQKAIVNLYNCKLGPGVTPFATQTTVLNKGGSELHLYNCSSGDTHYNFAHYDLFGSTVATSSIYANSGARYDGTNGVSWEITTSEYCSYWTPYVSPWIQKYHNGTSAITPRLEVLRDGSSTAYYDDEVWGEFSYQGASGYPLGVMVSDRMTPLGSRAAQGSSALGASDWAGESGASWFGKLEPASVTPAEIGHLMARVVVGKPSTTVYVDPTIRTS